MEKFYFITHKINDSEFNIASEEYLLKQKDGYYFYLWQNAKSVIIGVNQNALEEVNLDYTKREGIKVVRRLTGGGAVYHDMGNVCYTVIAPYDREKDNYKEFTKPVVEYLSSLGLNATLSGRNDVLIDEKKISGTAQTVHKDRIMHHGTLLFDTDAEVLTKALNPNPLKMQSKGIKSVKSRVTNVKEHLAVDMTIEEFIKGLEEKFLSFCKPYTFTEQDKEGIEKLRKEKYSTYEWNIGRSPKGEIVLEEKFPFGVFKLTFNTEKGLIKDAEITGDFFSIKDVSEFSSMLNGRKYDKIELEKVFSKIDEYVVGANGREILEVLF